MTDLTGKQQTILREALRRFLRWGDDYKGDLLQAWTGLGFYTDYKPVLDAGLMEWVHDRPYTRCMGWLRLTSAGAEIVQRWLDEGDALPPPERWEETYEIAPRRF